MTVIFVDILGNILITACRRDDSNNQQVTVGFLVNDQLDAHFFSMCLFQFSTCFEQLRAHHQENQLYQYNIWYMLLCVGDRFVCTRNGHRHRVTYTRCCIDTIDSPDDEQEVARNM